MKAEQLIERVAVALETMDRRMASIESEIASSVALAEDETKNIESMANGIAELREMFVRQGDGIDELKAMLGNYIEATRGMRLETQKLQSEVREKLKAVGG